MNDSIKKNLTKAFKMQKYQLTEKCNITINIKH